MIRWSLLLVLLMSFLPALARAEAADGGSADASVEDDADNGDDADGGTAGNDKTNDEKTGWTGHVEARLGFGETQVSSAQPLTGEVLATLLGSLEPSDKLSFDWTASLTHEDASPPAAGSTFGDSGANIGYFSLGPTWTPDDHWTASLIGSYSPKSTDYSDSQLQLSKAGGGQADIDALLRTVSSAWGINLTGSYDTDVDSNWEHSIGAGASFTDLTSTQDITEDSTSSGKVEKLGTFVKSHCQTSAENATALCKRARALVSPQEVNLYQLALNANYTATLFQHTDVMIGATYYIYPGTTDPTTIGYFNVAAAGHTSRTSGAKSERGAGQFDFGSGVPLEPLLFGINAGVSQKFGETGWKLALTGGWADYYDSAGYEATLGVKVQYKLNKHWRFSLALAGSLDDSYSDGTLTPYGCVVGGVRYSW